MLRLISTKFFKFASFAAKSAGLPSVRPVNVHSNGNTGLYGRFRRRK